MTINIPRELDLSLAADQKILREVSEHNAQLSSLIDNYLNQYLELFPEPHWRKLSWGASLLVPTGTRRTHHMELERLLRVTESLARLRNFPGFSKLVRSLWNPPQIAATFFEVDVAAWCANRAVTKSVEFSPEVRVRGGSKYPDFLWHTEIGSLYCECKRGTEFENAFVNRLNRLHKVLEIAYREYEPWDRSFRLDLSITSSAKRGVEGRIKSVVAQVSAAFRQNNSPDAVFQEGEVTGVLRRIQDHPLLDELPVDTLSTGSVTVGSQPVGINDSHLRISISVAKHRANAAANLLREARRQLPAGSASAVFIQIGSGAFARDKIKELLVNPVYSNTPWVGIWSEPRLEAVWRNGQPFDNRLLL